MLPGEPSSAQMDKGLTVTAMAREPSRALSRG